MVLIVLNHYVNFTSVFQPMLLDIKPFFLFCIRDCHTINLTRSVNQLNIDILLHLIHYNTFKQQYVCLSVISFKMLYRTTYC